MIKRMLTRGLLRTLSLFAAAALTCVSANGATADSTDVRPLRPVLSAYSIEAGSASNADTYLTPLRYSGVHVGLGYERMQAMAFNPRDWVMQLDLSLNGENTKNPVRNATMWSGDLRVRWTMMRRWQPVTALPQLTLAIGPGAGLRAGVLYLSRNGNNPASAKGAFTLDIRAMAAYPLRVGSLPLTLRYQTALPLTGAFFAPHYGQLYYEIWLGERSGLVRPAWWGNYFAMDNLVTADIHLGGTILRMGYHNNIVSTKASNVVSRCITHAFTIGVVTEWLSLDTRRRRAVDTARIISALYQ